MRCGSVVKLFNLILMELDINTSDIGIWLKSLRLHKYDWLVSSLDYHQLLSLDNEALEAKGVTKGARHKLLQSIARLSQRSESLNAIEKVRLSCSYVF